MRRFFLALFFLAGTMVLPRLAAAEDILTICGCPPNACPAGYTQFASGALPLPTGCSGGCAGGGGPDMVWWRQCTRCGDNYCRSGVENGSICGKDCCDSLTSCNTTRVNTTDVYCRRFKTDIGPSAGVWTVWQWYFVVDLADAFVYGVVGYLLLSRVRHPVAGLRGK